MEARTQPSFAHPTRDGSVRLRFDPEAINVTDEPAKTTSIPAEEHAVGLTWCAIQAFAGGAFYGLVDGASVVAAETLDLSKLQQGLLMVLDALSLGVVTVLATLPSK